MPDPSPLALANTVLRLGNPWLIGKNYGRVVPLYVLHNVASRIVPDKGSREELVRALARAINPPIDSVPCLNTEPLDPAQRNRLQRALWAVYGPDRRIFIDHSDEQRTSGSATPILAGLVASTPSDDGWGSRLADVLDASLKFAWRDKLRDLIAPTDFSSDPVTSLTAVLLGKDVAVSVGEDVEKRALSPLEKRLARFIDTLLSTQTSLQRLTALRELGLGLYLAAYLLMLFEPIPTDRKDQRLVLAYSGLPPGSSGDPLVDASARSFSRLINAGWEGTVIGVESALKSVRASKDLQEWRRWAERVVDKTADLGKKSEQYRPKLEEMLKTLSRKKSLKDRDYVSFIVRDVFCLPSSELAKRARNIGTTLGMAGPDRGRGQPRLCFETPVLGVLVRGICGSQAMQFEEFVSVLRDEFHIVVGPGGDDTVAERLGPIWTGGDGESLLQENEDLFRLRLVRAGLARAYSDAHTEVAASLASPTV